MARIWKTDHSCKSWYKCNCHHTGGLSGFKVTILSQNNYTFSIKIFTHRNLFYRKMHTFNKIHVLKKYLLENKCMLGAFLEYMDTEEIQQK